MHQLCGRQKYRRVSPPTFQLRSAFDLRSELPGPLSMRNLLARSPSVHDRKTLSSNLQKESADATFAVFAQHALFTASALRPEQPLYAPFVPSFPFCTSPPRTSYTPLDVYNHSASRLQISHSAQPRTINPRVRGSITPSPLREVLRPSLPPQYHAPESQSSSLIPSVH
ncbi:unnamed protein product [Lota lota]